MHAYLSRWLLSILLFSLAYGCAPAALKSSLGSKWEATAASPAYNVTGVWQGRSYADCPIITVSNPGRCEAMQYITLTMFQQGSNISGSYRCAYGNENCRDMAETGVISNGQMTAKLLRIVIMLDDDSMCRFTGMPQNDILEGRYQCHWGGPMEQGSFRVERSY